MSSRVRNFVLPRNRPVYTPPYTTPHTISSSIVISNTVSHHYHGQNQPNSNSFCSLICSHCQGGRWWFHHSPFFISRLVQVSSKSETFFILADQGNRFFLFFEVFIYIFIYIFFLWRNVVLFDHSWWYLPFCTWKKRIIINRRRNQNAIFGLNLTKM